MKLFKRNSIAVVLNCFKKQHTCSLHSPGYQTSLTQHCDRQLARQAPQPMATTHQKRLNPVALLPRWCADKLLEATIVATSH